VEQLIARDEELDPFEDPLVFRKMIEFLSVMPINLEMNKWKREGDNCKWRWDKPPKEGDGSWHMKMVLMIQMEKSLKGHTALRKPIGN
jgi:hypothetical protein